MTPISSLSGVNISFTHSHIAKVKSMGGKRSDFAGSFVETGYRMQDAANSYGEYSDFRVLPT